MKNGKFFARLMAVLALSAMLLTAFAGCELPFFKEKPAEDHAPVATFVIDG